MLARLPGRVFASSQEFLDFPPPLEPLELLPFPFPWLHHGSGKMKRSFYPKGIKHL